MLHVLKLKQHIIYKSRQLEGQMPSEITRRFLATVKESDRKFNAAEKNTFDNLERVCFDGSLDEIMPKLMSLKKMIHSSFESEPYLRNNNLPGNKKSWQNTRDWLTTNFSKVPAVNPRKLKINDSLRKTYIKSMASLTPEVKRVVLALPKWKR